MKVFVSEVFLSFQGEGVNVGKPRVFIRLATGCPLSCKFCDTKYVRSISRSLSRKDLELIKSYPYLVFTGNEPLFMNGPQYILSVIYTVKPKYVEIETNGTHIPSTIELLIPVVDLWTISPKDPSTQSKKVDTTPYLLDWLIKNSCTNFVVKFVYDNERSGVYILDMVSRFKIPNDKIWIMPRGENRSVYHNHLKQAWEFALAHKFNLSPRLHIDTFDKKRGV